PAPALVHSLSLHDALPICRLLQPEFLALLATRTAPGGRLHLATDWADYALHMQEVLAGSPQWRVDPRHADPTMRPAWRIETHFEDRKSTRLNSSHVKISYA